MKGVGRTEGAHNGASPGNGEWHSLKGALRERFSAPGVPGGCLPGLPTTLSPELLRSPGSEN